METIKRPPEVDKELPERPLTDNAAETYNDGRRLSELLRDRTSKPALEPGRSSHSRALEIRALEEHNRTLEAEVRKNYKIHIISEKLVEEVRVSTAQLKEAVLTFRRAHKTIEEDFRNEEEGRQEECLRGHQF
jgi:hypothetical protein